jgi:hypothetical protein
MIYNVQQIPLSLSYYIVPIISHLPHVLYTSGSHCLLLLILHILIVCTEFMMLLSMPAAHQMTVSPWVQLKDAVYLQFAYQNIADVHACTLTVLNTISVCDGNFVITMWEYYSPLRGVIFPEVLLPDFNLEVTSCWYAAIKSIHELFLEE